MVLNNSNLEVTGVEWSQGNIREYLNGLFLNRFGTHRQDA